jgi:hypothetical protein
VPGFRDKFLLYRFDIASLTFDCIACFFRLGGAWRRALALFGAFLLMAPPIYVLAVGDGRFGDKWAFGLTLVAAVVVLEAPGHRWRRKVASGEGEDGSGFDLFLFTLFTLIGVIAAPLILFSVEIQSSGLQGIAWGVALVGAQDFVRSAIALYLTLLEGQPVYS